MKDLRIDLNAISDDQFETVYYHLSKDKNKIPILCRMWLDKLFVMPRKKGAPITVIFNKTPHANAYKVKFPGRQDVKVHFEGRWNEIILTIEADELTRKLGLRNGEEYWVSIEV